MHKEDAIYLDQLCPKNSNKNWRDSLHKLTKYKGGKSITSNCVPCCLSCNGMKSDSEVLAWYRNQNFYDPRRSMAIRAWFNEDLKLASTLLSYVK